MATHKFVDDCTVSELLSKLIARISNDELHTLQYFSHRRGALSDDALWLRQSCQTSNEQIAHRQHKNREQLQNITQIKTRQNGS